MKTKTSYFINLLLLIFSTLIIINSCGNREETVSCFPNSRFNITLLPSNMNDLQNKGWTYVDIYGAGTRGLIVSNSKNTSSGSGYIAFDRNAPQFCPGDDTTLEVKDGVIFCPKDGSKWFLSSGGPITGNPTSFTPKIYPTDYYPATNTISVYN